MSKKLVKRFLPNPDVIRKSRYLRIFGKKLYHSNFWEVTPESTSRGLGIGVFACWLPMPFQSVVAAALALLFRGNILIAVGSVFISNPITMPAMLYFGCWFGQKILGRAFIPFQWSHSFNDQLAYFQQFALPIVIGTVACGVFFGILSYFGMRFAWTLTKNKNRSTQKYDN